MRSPFLFKFASLIALSVGLVTASTPDTLEKRAVPKQAPLYDAMGISSNLLVCSKDKAYNKREAYAVVREAATLMKQNKFVVAGCESLKVCSRYPKEFKDTTVHFKFEPPYWSFPILPDGKLYNGGRLPVRDLVIFDREGEVAGIVTATATGYRKCLLDDNFTERPKGFVERLKNKYHYWRGSK